MSRRSAFGEKRSVRVAAVWAVVAAWPCFFPSYVEAQAEITAMVETTGRVVFTNMASSPVSPATAGEVTDLRRPAPPAPLGASYATLIETISARHGVSPTLVRAVIEVESAFNRYAVSSKNARGLMQLIPETGRRFGVRDFFDPQQNIDGGVRYLRFLLDKFDENLDLTLAAYNSGENRVARLGRIPNIPETVNYVRKVRAAISRMGGVTSPGRTTARMDGPPGDGSRPALSEVPIAATTDGYGVRTFSNLNGY